MAFISSPRQTPFYHKWREPWQTPTVVRLAECVEMGDETAHIILPDALEEAECPGDLIEAFRYFLTMAGVQVIWMTEVDWTADPIDVSGWSSPFYRQFVPGIPKATAKGTTGTFSFGLTMENRGKWQGRFVNWGYKPEYILMGARMSHQETINKWLLPYAIRAATTHQIPMLNV